MLKYAIFDLDDTLYASDHGLLDEIGYRIQVWLRDTFELTWQEAVDMRRRYYERYGTTLGGLIVEHDADIPHYLEFVHDVPIDDYLTPHPELDAMLRAIPLRKAIYTNATSSYGRRVLRRLGILPHFEHIIGIEEVDLRNKPYRDPYKRVLGMLDTTGPDCVMVEDSSRNLKPAKELGMWTILVDGEREPHVDFAVSDVLQVGDVIQKLLARCPSKQSVTPPPPSTN